MRHFLSMEDLSSREIEELLNEAFVQKKRRRSKKDDSLAGKSIGLIFNKPSTRTRVSFEVAINELGGFPVALSFSEMQSSRGEPIKDTARVLSRYLDAVVIRTFKQEELWEYARFGSIPVINALTDREHPCQIIADMMTIVERKGTLKGVKICYFGAANNVSNSLMLGATKMGAHVFVCCPSGHEPSRDVLEAARRHARESGGEVDVVNDPASVVGQADVLYTDVWISMGEENKEIDIEEFMRFQLNDHLLSCAKGDAIVMHCLPAHRDMEITDSVIESGRSVVFDQAENRLHAHKAILKYVFGL